MPAAAVDDLVREPLGPAGTDGSYQVSGGAGRGLGPSVSCRRLLDRPLQQGTGFSTPVSSVVAVPCPLRMKKGESFLLKALIHFTAECYLTQEPQFCLLMTGLVLIRDEKGFGSGGIGPIHRHLTLRLLR